MIIQDNIDEYNALKPHNFQILQSTSIWRNSPVNANSKVNINIILDSTEEKKAGSLHLEFREVFGLNLDHIEGASYFWMSIDDVRGDQIEGAKFRVDELADHVIAFYCRTFQAQILSI